MPFPHLRNLQNPLLTHPCLLLAELVFHGTLSGHPWSSWSLPFPRETTTSQQVTGGRVKSACTELKKGQRRVGEWASLFPSFNPEGWQGQVPLVLFPDGEILTSLIHSTNVCWISFLIQTLDFHLLFNEQPGGSSFFSLNFIFDTISDLEENCKKSTTFPYALTQIAQMLTCYDICFITFSLSLLFFSKPFESQL